MKALSRYSSWGLSAELGTGSQAAFHSSSDGWNRTVSDPPTQPRLPSLLACVPPYVSGAGTTDIVDGTRAKAGDSGQRLHTGLESH